MFGFRKKKNVPLFIRAKDVASIIQSDYRDGVAFCLIEFQLDGKLYTMGSVLLPNQEERQENIYFVFDGKRYDTYEEFLQNAVVDGIRILDTDTIIEVVHAGIVDGEPLIQTPWGETRLAKMAIQPESEFPGK
jgi:hypothetical protein